MGVKGLIQTTPADSMTELKGKIKNTTHLSSYSGTLSLVLSSFPSPVDPLYLQKWVNFHDTYIRSTLELKNIRKRVYHREAAWLILTVLLSWIFNKARHECFTVVVVLLKYFKSTFWKIVMYVAKPLRTLLTVQQNQKWIRRNPIRFVQWWPVSELNQEESQETLWVSHDTPPFWT